MFTLSKAGLWMKPIIILFCFLFNLLFVPYPCAADNTCWISTGQQDVWVIIYDANEEGDREGVLWEGKIPAGEKVKVKSTKGHIRYQYKTNPNEGYEGDLSTECYQQITVLVD